MINFQEYITNLEDMLSAVRCRGKNNEELPPKSRFPEKGAASTINQAMYRIDSLIEKMPVELLVLLKGDYNPARELIGYKLKVEFTGNNYKALGTYNKPLANTPQTQSQFGGNNSNKEVQYESEKMFNNIVWYTKFFTENINEHSARIKQKLLDSKIISNEAVFEIAGDEATLKSEVLINKEKLNLEVKLGKHKEYIGPDSILLNRESTNYYISFNLSNAKFSGTGSYIANANNNHETLFNTADSKKELSIKAEELFKNIIKYASF